MSEQPSVSLMWKKTQQREFFQGSMFHVAYDVYFLNVHIGFFEPVICFLCDFKMKSLSFEDKSKIPIYFCVL